MKNSFLNNRFLLVIFHFLLGVILLSSFFSKLYAILVFFIGGIIIYKSKNKDEQAAMVCAYIAGSDVVFRMTGGMLSYEMHKYIIAFFLILALIIEKKKSPVQPIFIFYILLLLIGIAFSDIPFPESVRKAITFNLSGPISLGIAAMYFYKRQFSIQKVLNILFYLALPAITIVSILYFRTPSISDISFGGGANFQTSGGYGPNQVSTVLGIGFFVLGVHLLYKKKYSSFLIFDVLILIYIFYRNLLTFSRGGLITALLAILFFGVLFIYSKKNRTKNLLKYLGVISIAGISIWLYTSDITGGMIENRYTNRNANGIKKKDITTGRGKLMNTEIQGLYKNPFFGMGVGSGKFRRLETTNIYAASHNEMSRLIGEHGAIGIIILFILILVPIFNAIDQPNYAKAFVGAFFIFWFLTINHSAMRVSFPGFIYALSLIRITIYSKEEIEVMNKQLLAKNKAKRIANEKRSKS